MGCQPHLGQLLAEFEGLRAWNGGLGYPPHLGQALPRFLGEKGCGGGIGVTVSHGVSGE